MIINKISDSNPLKQTGDANQKISNSIDQSLNDNKLNTLMRVANQKKTKQNKKNI